MKRSVYRKTVIFAAICLLAAGALLFSVFFGSNRRWHCSASRVRPSGAVSWEKARISASPVPEPNENIFNNFTVSSDQDSFFVVHSMSNTPDNPYAFEVRTMLPDESLDIGGGTLKLCSIGTAYLAASHGPKEDAIYRFYDSRLQSLTDERLREAGTFGTTESGGNFRYSPFPAVALIFEHEGIDDLMFQGIRVIDSSTKKELTYGYRSGWRQAYYRISTHIPLWHRTPVDVIVDVSYGPSKTFEFAPRAGEGFREGNFQCRLICPLDGVNTFSSRTTSRGNMIEHIFPKALLGNGGSRIILACQPTADRMPVTFAFLDADGRILPGGGSDSSGVTYSACLNCPLEKIALIRASYRPRRERIFIHLPYIPGLPEENQAVEDLFDVHIPYVRFYDPTQISEFLRHVLQLNSSRRTGPVPADSIDRIGFPWDVRNTTVRDIARIYAEGGDLIVDTKNERMSLEYPLPLKDRIIIFFRKILRR